MHQTNFIYKRIEQLLLEADCRVWNEEVLIKPDKLEKESLLELKNMYYSMGGLQNLIQLEAFSVQYIHFEQDKKALIIDNSTSFNRYRLQTLRSDFYSQHNFFKTEEYKALCRQKEIECLKDGSGRALWESKESSFHFGDSAAAGELYGNGSSGWKLKALYDFITDIYFSRMFASGFRRISLYDKFLASGQLLILRDHLLPNSPHTSGVANFIKGKMDIKRQIKSS